MLKRSEADREPASGHVVLTLIGVIIALRMAEDVFIPIALAILLSFALTPLIVKLCQWKFPKPLAILTSVALAFSFIGLMGWMVSHQIAQFSQHIPEYQNNIRIKMQNFKNITPEAFVRLTAMTSALKKVETPPPLTYEKKEERQYKPMLVRLETTQPSLIEQINNVLNPLLGPLGTALIVIIFVISILFHREDLRERFILLISRSNLNLATQAIDDATNRITKYLLMNLVVNALFGLAITLGLFFIGIPNALLWGLLTALLKFIPFLGIWIAASIAMILAFSIDPGWSMLIMTLALFAIIEFFSVYFLEPKVYGASTGISSLALLVAAVFWTWIWGAVGLFLSVPLTVCIFLLGKYVVGFEFLEVLLGSQPVFKPDTLLYQRLLAMDEEEALKISKDFLKGASLCDYYDHLLIPALTLAEEDRHRGMLAEHRQKFILEETGELIDTIFLNDEGSNNSVRELMPNVICLPALDESDELVARMLAQLLKNEGINTNVIKCVALSDETFEFLHAHKPKIICISSLPPYALSPARSICKKINQILPNTQVIVGIWGLSSNLTQLEQRVGCAAVVVSLKEAITQIKILAGIDIVSTQPDTISPHELELLTMLQNEDFVDVPLQELSTVVIKKIAKAFDVPTSLASLIVTDRHFWKASSGVIPELDEARENMRDTPVCEYVITANKTLVVENIEKDTRFASDEWLQERGILFYAGTPLRSKTGHAVGVLCVIDTKPRNITEKEQVLLETLAEVLMQKVNS